MFLNFAHLIKADLYALSRLPSPDYFGTKLIGIGVAGANALGAVPCQGTAFPKKSNIMNEMPRFPCDT